MHLQQATKFEQLRGAASQVNSGKIAQAGYVVERFFAGKVSQIKAVLNKVDAQHAFKSNWGTALPRFG